ncbi:MAG TPA: cytochrome c oxidase assembly protein [Acidimicrobiales bacterium]|nr:cytochrome c oxidase assembly protein [Acidimicrobiales bacterium]
MIGLLAYGEAPSAAVRAHILLLGVQTGPLALIADAFEAAAIVWYLAGVRRLARRGRRWPLLSSAAFVGGVVAVWVGIGSGLAAYDDVNVTLHVVQHLLLMMVAPPLITLGRPITLASQAAHHRTQVKLLKVVHSRVVAVLTFPVLTWFLYYGMMYAMLEDRGVYDYTVAHPLVHDGVHLALLAVGFLYWQPLVGTDPTRWRLPLPARAGSIFLGMPFEAFLGISISEFSVPIDPINTLANTHMAGDTFWTFSMAISALCIATVAAQWFRQLEREKGQEDRRARVQAEASTALARQLGVEGVREGWSVPWWRLAELEAQRRRRPDPGG